MDQSEIKRLIDSEQFSSMSDIILFIINHVSKTINIDPLQDLSLRVDELQKSKGLDRVMIEQVKALTEAIIDQRQEGLRKELEKILQDNFYAAIETQDNSRKTLNEIDFINLMNMQHVQSQQINKKLSQPVDEVKVQRLDIIRREMTQMRNQVERKMTRKEGQQLQVMIAMTNKELISKISAEETQKIFIKFQREIFDRMNKVTMEMQKIQHQMKKNLSDEIYSLRTMVNDVKMQGSSVQKIDKRMKKCLEKCSALNDKLQQHEDSRKKIKDEIKHYKSEHIEQMNELNQLVEEIIEDKKATVVVKKCESSSAVWLARDMLKNCQVAWEQQLYNNDDVNLVFETHKTNIKIADIGHYEIICLIFGGNGGNIKKMPTICANGEALVKMDCKGVAQSTALPLYSARQIVYLAQGRSLLTVKTDPDSDHTSVLLKVTKL